MRHLISIFLIATILTLTTTPILARDVKRVLLIHSYHQGLSWRDSITASILEIFKKDPTIQLHVEYMDSKRIGLKKASHLLLHCLKEKFQKEPPHIILAADNNALVFLKKHLKTRFHKVPIVFCGINDYKPEMLTGFAKNITGVVEKTSPLKTAQLMKEVLPDFRRLVLITGTSPAARSIGHEATLTLKDLDPSIQKEWWRGLSKKLLISRLKKLKKGDAVLLILFNRDSQGTYFSYEESAQFITQASPVPVFGLWDFYLGSGVTGGYMASSHDQGKLAALLAIQVLEGISPHELPVQESSPNRPMFYYPTLEKHHIPLEKLPPSSVIQNRPSNDLADFFSTLNLLVLVAFALILIVLTFQIFSRLLREDEKAPEFTKQLSQMVISVAAMGLILATLLWAGQDYLRFQKRRMALRETLTTELHSIIRSQVDRAMETIAFLKKSENQRSRNALASRTLEALGIAQTIFKERIYLPRQDISHLVVEALSTIRWNNNKGHYLMLSLSGELLSHPDRPDLVGTNVLSFEDPNGTKPFERLTQMAKAKGEGFLSYTWLHKIGDPHTHPVLTHIRRIPELNLLVGTSERLDDRQNRIKALAQKQLASLSFADDRGELFIKTYEGTELMHRGHPDLEGKNLWGLTAPGGQKVVQEIIAAAKRPDGGFVTHLWNHPQTGKLAKKLAFVRGVGDWKWAVGAETYLSDMEQTLAKTRREMVSAFSVRLGLMMVGMALLGLFCTWLGRHLASRLTLQFRTFQQNFTASADRPMDPGLYRHAEFQHLATGINEVQMAREKARTALMKQTALLKAIFAATPGLLILKDFIRVLALYGVSPLSNHFQGVRDLCQSFP